MARPKKQPTMRDKLTPEQMRMVEALADNDMVVSAAAQELNWSNCGLRYHLHKIYELTGLNPTRFYDLQKLLLMEVEE